MFVTMFTSYTCSVYVYMSLVAFIFSIVLTELDSVQLITEVIICMVVTRNLVVVKILLVSHCE